MDISLETKLLTTKEVASFLRISTHQVNRLCRKGVLRRIQITERTFRFREEDLLEFLGQAVETGALEHRDDNQEAKWHLPSKLHFHSPNDGQAETLPSFAWDKKPK